MRMYQHLGLGLAGLATALSLNLIENFSVRTCVEKKNIPGYADFLRLINYPGGFVESTLYHFIIDRAPEKKIKEELKLKILDTLAFGKENIGDLDCKRRVSELEKLIGGLEW